MAVPDNSVRLHVVVHPLCTRCGYRLSLAHTYHRTRDCRSAIMACRDAATAGTPNPVADAAAHGKVRHYRPRIY